MPAILFIGFHSGLGEE